jgi:hypothetical protein
MRPQAPPRRQEVIPGLHWQARRQAMPCSVPASPQVRVTRQSQWQQQLLELEAQLPPSHFSESRTAASQRRLPGAAFEFKFEKGLTAAALLPLRW